MLKRKSSKFENGFGSGMFDLAMLGIGGLCLVAAATSEHDAKVNKASNISYDMARIKEKGLVKFKAEVEDPEIVLESEADIDKYASKKASQYHNIKNGACIDLMNSIFKLKALLIIMARKRYPLMLQFEGEENEFNYVSPLKLYLRLDDWAYKEFVLCGTETSMFKADIAGNELSNIQNIEYQLSSLVQGLTHEIFQSITDESVMALQDCKDVPFLKGIKPVDKACELIQKSAVSDDFIWKEELQKKFIAKFEEIRNIVSSQYNNNGQRIAALRGVMSTLFKVMQSFTENDLNSKLEEAGNKYIKVPEAA